MNWIKKLLRPRPAFETWKTIQLGTGLLKREDFCNAIEGSGYKVPEWGNAILGAKGYAVTRSPQEVDLVKVTVEELGFHEPRNVPLYGDSVTRSDIYRKAMALGLKLCRPDVGPQLRLQYPDQPYGESLAIAMESIIDLQGDLSIFCVAHDKNGCWLSGAYGNPDGFWKRTRAFVFTARERAAAKSEVLVQNQINKDVSKSQHSAIISVSTSEMLKRTIAYECNLVPFPPGMRSIPTVNYALDEFEAQFHPKDMDVSCEIGKENMALRISLTATQDELETMSAGLQAILRRRQLIGPTDAATRMKYQPNYEESIGHFFARMSKTLTEQHGMLQRVHFMTHYPKFEIEFYYADGTCIYSGQRAGHVDIHYLSYGYAGDGPSCLASFLKAAGFATNHDEVSRIDPGSVIHHPARTASS